MTTPLADSADPTQRLSAASPALRLATIFAGPKLLLTFALTDAAAESDPAFTVLR